MESLKDESNLVSDIKFIENYMVIGDLNYDILTPDKSQVLDDLCDIFDLTNIVKNPTCFMKGCEPSL
jgi:hypothetical protein